MPPASYDESYVIATSLSPRAAGKRGANLLLMDVSGYLPRAIWR